MKTTLVHKRVHMGRLRRTVTALHYGYGQDKDKLPRDMECTLLDVPLYSAWGQDFLGYYTIRVVKGSEGKRRGQSPHRIFVVVNDRLIPAGRLAQAKA
jgi:hypothetical protein